MRPPAAELLPLSQAARLLARLRPLLPVRGGGRVRLQRAVVCFLFGSISERECGCRNSSPARNRKVENGNRKAGNCVRFAVRMRIVFLPDCAAGERIREDID